MKPIAGLLPLAVAGTILFAPEAAEALRCKGKIVKEGDPQAKVLNYCGEPVRGDDYTFEDFQLVNYQHHPAIKAPVAV